MSTVRPILIHVSALIQCGEHILLVQEAKEENYGKWNLPGGHIEPHESLVTGMFRECQEEVEIQPELTGLIGIYTGDNTHGVHAIRFVFAGNYRTPYSAKAGDEILAVRWIEFAEAELLDAKDVVNPVMFQAILRDAINDLPTPLSLLKESFS